MSFIRNLIFLIVFVCASCADENSIEDLSSQKLISNKELVFNKTYSVKDSVIIENCIIQFVDSSVFLMGQNAKIIFKNCSFLTSKKKKYFVHFRPKNSSEFWDRLYFYGCGVVLENMKFNEGLISCINSTVSLKNIRLKTKKDRIKDQKYPFVYLIKSNGIVSNCTLENLFGKWNGEGIVVEDGNVSVLNSIIKNIPDAIEFTRSENAEIKSNHIYNSLDDAIDLNACRNITIINNKIFGALDKGISIGGDIAFSDKLHPVKWGKSTGIRVENNFVNETRIGISIKDSSEVFLKENILKNNKVDIVK